MGLGVPIPNTLDGSRGPNVSAVLETTRARDRLIRVQEVVAMRVSQAILATVLIAGTVVSAGAQSRRIAQRAGPIGGMAPQPPPPHRQVAQPPYGSQYDHVPYASAQYGSPIVGTVPVVLMPDGRIYADFGYGYEPVIRSCAAAAPVTYASPPAQYSPPTYATPTYNVPSYDPPAYARPGATSSTSSQMSGQVASMRLRSSTYPVIPACWVTDAYGRVVVLRQ